MKPKISRILRKVTYSTPIHRWLGIGNSHFDSAYWNQKLSDEFKTYLGGTVNVEVRNALAIQLAKMISPHARTLLDVGCASGSLGRYCAADKYTYVGIDISEFAIEEARKYPVTGEFYVSSLQSYQPDRHHDVIYFNEILYYLGVDESIAELQRYCNYLSPNGIVIVSMKCDPKSEAIFSEAKKKFEWINGFVYQEKLDGPEYALHFSREQPAHLMGAFRNV
jgi:2-polyprenyl-3-methyl-5-hydroxy-6-metoxy-1,4-benzoquinol methylase